MAVTGNKQIARNMLSRAGVPVPQGRAFPASQKELAVGYAEDLGYPVVVKPLAGTGGTGVVANLTNRKDLTWAIDALSETKHRRGPFIVEEHIDGDDYRFFVLGEKVLSVLHRTPGAVIGDGRLTVAELILQKNEFRRDNPHLRTRPIKVGQAARFQLEKQSLTFESIPAFGQRVVLTVAGNLSQGGDSIEVLPSTHPSLLEAAVAAVSAIPGLPHAGIDFLITDPTRPLREQAAAICEVNSTPGQTANDFPVYGSPRPVSMEMIRWYAHRHSVELQSTRSEVDVALRITGLVQGVGFRGWLADRCNALDVDGSVANTEDGTVEARLTGDVESVAAIASLAVVGPRAAKVDSVQTFPVENLGVTDLQAL